MKKLTWLFLLCVIMGCDVQDGPSGPCTNEFHILSVEVLNPDAGRVFLDSFKVVNVRTNEELTLNEGKPTIMDLMMSIYPIVDDSQKDKFKHNSDVEVLFTGYIDEEEVCSREFSIGNDGCHLYIAKGSIELIVDK